MLLLLLGESGSKSQFHLHPDSVTRFLLLLHLSRITRDVSRIGRKMRVQRIVQSEGCVNRRRVSQRSLFVPQCTLICVLGGFSSVVPVVCRRPALGILLLGTIRVLEIRGAGLRGRWSSACTPARVSQRSPVVRSSP